jgi:phage gpG-like protein
MKSIIISASLDEQSLQDTLKALKKFGKDAEKVVKNVVDLTALDVETDAKDKLKGNHVKTNRLRASIHREIKPNQSFNYSDNKGGFFDGSLKVNFGEFEAITGTNVEYAASMEFGSKPHKIEAKPGKVLAFQMSTASSLVGRVDLYFNKKTGRWNKNTSKGTLIFAKSVNHPGFHGDSFLRYAVEKNKQKFVKRMTEALNKLINGIK